MFNSSCSIENFCLHPPRKARKQKKKQTEERQTKQNTSNSKEVQEGGRRGESSAIWLPLSFLILLLVTVITVMDWITMQWDR